MCGVVAVLRRRSSTPPPDAAALAADVAAALERLAAGPSGWAEVADRLAAVGVGLRGPAGVRLLTAVPDLARSLEETMADARSAVAGLEDDLDSQRLLLTGADLEAANAAIVRLKDAIWAIASDRLRVARQVAALAGARGPGGVPRTNERPGDAALDAYWSIQVALSSLDRLEVRGRDSAGVHLLVTGHGLDPSDPDIAARGEDPLFCSGSVRLVPAENGQSAPSLAFVYKAAAEIGELGDNIRALRTAITADDLLRRALASPEAEVTVLGHTRWASVGLISEANAHPLNGEEADQHGPYVAATLNGDVDNHVELRAAEGLITPPEITTDAKVIPMLVSRRMAWGLDPVEAFRQTVATFEGSVAIAASTAAEPGSLLLALRGSGQALYIGLADDAYVIASEPYGVVEETARYVRMDGETTGGQVVVLRRPGAGTLAGLERSAYFSGPLPVGEEEVITAEITTRDVDRAGFPHFLLKEVSEAPESFRKTLRGKVVEEDGRLTVVLGDDTLPAEVRKALGAGSYRRVLVIGQGTAAVAGQILAGTLSSVLPAAAGMAVAALPASELSGFGLDDDMSDTLVVAISQSGTTTDTNRTVDLVRARGAAVLAVVNRRNSDLVEKADGVLYTSDGRDVEMSVASTKAFYAQVAAGFLLSLAIAKEAGDVPGRLEHELLAGLRDLPTALEEVIAQRPDIAAAAWEHAPRRRHWAVVGNGPNRLAASELRIKLSELAYKSIACDSTEDKKHIDLSCEPLILVCAAGLPPSAAADVAKELAIYRARKAAPVVIATRGAAFPAALAVIEVPPVHPRLAFVLSAMAGHLFGYEAALAIDAQARGLREMRAVVKDIVGDEEGPPEHLLVRLAPRVVPGARTFSDGLRSGVYNGALEAGTAVELASVLRYATRALPLELYELNHGRVGTPGAVVEDLVTALTRAIDELTRPVDAIRHQAKTVTVGISRSEEVLFRAPLVAAVLTAGAPRDRLTYRVLRTLGSLGAAVEEVTGSTRYRIEGSVGAARIHVVDKGGVAAGLDSRAEREGGDALRGTKHRAATLQEVTVARGGTDGRTVVLVPEIKRGAVVGMTLLHARFADRLPADAMRAVLEGYQARYGALVDAVTETTLDFDDDRLAGLAVIDLLTSPVHVLAESWRR